MKFNEITFFDYGYNKKYYAFIINNYNKLKDSKKSFDETWAQLIDLDEFKMLDIDDDIVEIAHTTMSAYYDTDEEDTETVEEDIHEIITIDTIPTK
jgi:hypothetical protein